MNDEEKANFLIHFTEWLLEHGIAVPAQGDVYSFMEDNR